MPITAKLLRGLALFSLILGLVSVLYALRAKFGTAGGPIDFVHLTLGFWLIFGSAPIAGLASIVALLARISQQLDALLEARAG